MAILSGFFNSVNGDRRYNAAQIGRYLQYIVSDGVFAYNSSSLQVLANDGMEVQVQAGRAMLDHHFMENDAPITLALAAGGSQDRIDGVIMYVDMTERACGIIVKEGTPAANPNPPAMTRTDVRKEYMLAAVRVPKLTSAITQSNITDTRPDNAVCGWVHGLIDQVDTSTLFAQWSAAYDEAVAQMLAWYESLPGNFVDGNGLPIPNPGDAGKTLRVNEGGTGYELSDGVKTDETLAIQGAAADAAAVGRALTVPNLLDNSDFTTPVNLNGKTSYTGIGYGIEKWFSSSGYSAITVNDGYVNIKSTNGTSAAYLLQFVEPGKIKSGKKYTAVCKLADGSHHIVTAAVSKTMTEAVKYIYVGGVQLGTIRIKYDAGQAQYAVLFSTTSTAGIDVEHVALYEGEYTEENMPVYRPRGYSIEAAICGGAGLNFKVVGGTTQPTNPTENTVWVNTSTTISSYVFAATEPSNPTAGMVWISTSTSSTVEFNALKKNGIQVYPTSVKQYVGGAWVDKIAKSYQSGEWVDWSRTIFDAGNTYESITGGYSGVGNYETATISNGQLHLSSAAGGATAALLTNNAIDLTAFKTITFVGYGDTGSYCRFGIATSRSTSFTASVDASTQGIYELDISYVTGSYYIGLWSRYAKHITCDKIVLK